MRVDYARDLLRAGETARAREQMYAAMLLDDEDPSVWALLGWVQLAEGAAPAAAVSAARALELGPWCDLARIVGARAQEAAGQSVRAAELLVPLRARIAAGASPEFVYRPKWGRYDEVHALPAVERAMLAEGK